MGAFGSAINFVLDSNGNFTNKLVALDANDYSESLGLFKSENIIWCYGINVLNIYDDDSKTFFKCYKKDDTNESVNFSVTGQVFQDREKNIWIVSDNGLYQATIVNNYVYSGNMSSFANSSSTFILPQSYNIVFAGSWGQGIVSLTNERTSLKTKMMTVIFTA